jgi:hypothetical protein
MIHITVDGEQLNYPLAKGSSNTSLSKEGNLALLKLFAKHNIRATFFITGYFAEREAEQVVLIKQAGHEIACHGYNHYYRGNKNLNLAEDIIKSKKTIEQITNEPLKGFRAPQLQYSKELIKILDELNFKYDSSLHPVYIPGHYNNSRMPHRPFRPIDNSDFLELPVSVGKFKIPMGWIFIRWLGINRIISNCKKLLKNDISPIIYVHSWEFADIKNYKIPFSYKYRTGKQFLGEIEKFIIEFKKEGFAPLEDTLK